jgi:phosphatidylserine/phosphatidylglycerophosphate/cardiolipin synthase-like enzyme
MFDFLKKNKDNTVGYSGSDTHKYIDEVINDNAVKLKIISPYLGIHYARMLLKVSTRKKIDLIVSGDSTKKDEEAIRVLLKRGSFVDWKLILYGSVVAILIALTGIYPLALSMGILLVATIYYGKIYGPKRRKVRIKIATDKFIHEKLYISENVAIVGSANLTYSGTHKNIEHIEIIRDKSKISELEKHFDQTWKKY